MPEVCMEYLLGVDIGTTGTKSAIYESNGTIVDKRYEQYPVYYPREGWAEQDADDWWHALVLTVRSLVGRHPVDIRAMSLSTQGGCLVLLDRNFHPVHRAVSWMDRRAREISQRLIKEIRPQELYRSSGWPVTNCLCFPTIYWFKRERPDIFNEARYFASTIDYLNYRLTGRFCIDHTNLALTGFLDLGTKGISCRTLDILGIGEKAIAQIVPSGTPIGTLTSEASELLGLRAGVIVVSGAHDQYCANIGVGATAKGSCVLDAGTSWVLLAVSGRLYFSRGKLSEGQGLWGIVFPGIHPLEGRYGLMAVVPYGGSSLTWFRDTFAKKESLEEFTEEASSVAPGCEGLLFVPVASSDSGRGAFVGVDTVHTLGHYKRSMLEGVALANRFNFEILQESGLEIERITMTGGGAKNLLWQQIVADILDVSVEIPDQKDPECLGAAILAGFGAGLFSSIEEAVPHCEAKKTAVEPIGGNSRQYQKLYEDFIRFSNYV
jgi:xylulokinase